VSAATTRRTRPTLSGWVLPGACGLVVALVALSQLAHVRKLLDVHELLTAGFAKALVLFYALAVGAIVVAAAFLAVRHLGRLVLAAAIVAAVPVLATLTVGAEIWAAVAAWLTLAACWQIGRWILHAVRVPALAELVPAAWLAGTVVLGLALLLLGRIGILEWWLAGVPVLAVGALGTVRLARVLAAGSARAAWAHVSGSRLGAASASVALLLFGLAAVFAAAPEIMFDPLYAKVWLPAEWARTGEIGPLVKHPVLNTLGFGQLLAVPGHLAGAEGVGRYLQLLAVALLVTAVWWGARGSAWAPLVAGALAITPHLFWQATTAMDDALLALAAVCMALAVIRALERPGPVLATGIALGLLAGALVDFKLHLGPLAAGLALGWWWLARAGVRGLGGLLAGGCVVVVPPLLMRWIDTGNPLLPAYNNIFKSQYWPHVNEQFNFPYYREPGSLGPLDVIVRSVTDTTVLNEAAPVGAFGLLVGALLVALVLAWRRGASRPAVTPALWLGLVFAALLWYQQLRYLRYLLPAAAVALVALGVLARGGRDPGHGTQRALLAVFAVLAVLLWPATVAQFWNVPGRDLPWEVALRVKSDDAYERQALAERGAVLAFDRLAPPGAMAVTDAHERAWLHDGRDFSPDWEFAARLDATGGQPEDPDEALRRVRALGASWIITGPSALAARPYVQALIARHAEISYADMGWTVYRLADRPRAPAALPRCDDRLAGRPGCWVGAGKLDDRPGYRAEESPAGISREVPVCPGDTVVVEASANGGSTPLTVAIDFDSSDALSGRGRGQVAPGTTAVTAGTAPPRATKAMVQLYPPVGMTVTEAKLSHTGTCVR
jgi:hypothetical protein